MHRLNGEINCEVFFVSTVPQIHIKTPPEKKDKLIQWYGWITIIILCLTPLVFILLPLLMMNTSKINAMLKESRVPEDNAVTGVVKEAEWKLENECGIELVSGRFSVLNNEGDTICCTFHKYVGKNSRALPDIHEGDRLEVTGQMKSDEDTLVARNIRNLSKNVIYTSEPSLSVY